MMEAPQSDPLAERAKNLACHEIASVGPLLALVGELLDDARRQYDRTATVVLEEVRHRLVGRLEDAVVADRWISVREASEVTHRPEATIREWCRREKIVARKLGGRDWEIDRESLYRQDERAV